jgi:hypothetical protein
MSQGIRSIKLAVLANCFEDHVGLWEVVRTAQDHLPGLTGDQLMAIVLRSLKDLLETELVEAGAPTPDGRGFVAWQSSPSETLTRIADAWSSLGRAPTIGEIVWFTTSPRGDQLLSEE